MSAIFLPSAGSPEAPTPASVHLTHLNLDLPPLSPAFSQSAVVLTGVQAGAGALQAAVSKCWMLFGLESESGQAGVASVPVNAVRRAGRPVRTRGRRHG